MEGLYGYSIGLLYIYGYSACITMARRLLTAFFDPSTGIQVRSRLFETDRCRSV